GEDVRRERAEGQRAEAGRGEDEEAAEEGTPQRGADDAIEDGSGHGSVRVPFRLARPARGLAPQHERALDDDLLVRGEAREDLHLAAEIAPARDRAALEPSLPEREEDAPVALDALHGRDRDGDDLLARTLPEPDLGRDAHPREQRAVLVRDREADGQRPRRAVDLRPRADEGRREELPRVRGRVQPDGRRRADADRVPL